ncbi:hypothetical protein [Paraburkholderia caballeronis]|uniref:Uncharacterized protein n=1 Tax=Paraburkholderia caballeronis TaxID=416943 RepID=A0A1H7TLN3_9BURK|nr:hypothetical protein [Paraburkholderia caballeronis]PXW18436.1 hypothetical protein C7403_116123 [Paraburkholderia caballeronis]PXW95716.1 hypothetical protein C7407_116123 [Paraburkholderia caballeronis]RAJ92062.1 hypothetical protein C7409_116123 [Paraburkholderia caballeronis]SEB75997.1 hypothetical protein SAMN05445871_1015 [Paraburkholderia caballeronis]SEL85256.1 hypothetical protein SAMN05192542_115123 [Paraburkholderia caballeronis]
MAFKLRLDPRLRAADISEADTASTTAPIPAPPTLHELVRSMERANVNAIAAMRNQASTIEQGKKRTFGKFRARCARSAITSISVEAPAWLREAREINREARERRDTAQAAERAAVLERDHFDRRYVDNQRIFFFYLTTKTRPFEIDALAVAVAESGPGKYDRANLLAAVMRCAAEAAASAAQEGVALTAPPPEVAAALRKIRQFGDDIDGAIEYAVTGQCSVMQRSYRVFALVYSHMSRQHDTTCRKIAAALPAPCPPSTETANSDATTSSLKKRRGETGRDANAIKGSRTRAKVHAAAAKIIAEHGTLASADTAIIAKKAGVSPRHARRVLDGAGDEIQRLAADIQTT